MANPAPIRHTSAEARARKRRRRKQRQDPDYREWIIMQPCLICGQAGEGHHQPYKSHAGWTDRSMVPLCPEHHRGAQGIHTLGREGFLHTHGLDLLAEARRIRAEYERCN